MVKLPEENMGDHLHQCWINDDFLNRIQEVLTIKKKKKRLINYFSFKLRNFVSPKDSKRLKRQTTPWMSYYRYMLPTKDLAPAFPQINKKNQTTHFKKGQRLDQDLPQRDHLSGQLPVSRCSVSLPCREIQTRTTVR